LVAKCRENIRYQILFGPTTLQSLSQEAVFQSGLWLRGGGFFSGEREVSGYFLVKRFSRWNCIAKS